MGIEFKCQTIGVLLTELLDKFFNSARITFKKSDREEIRNRQKWICKICKEPFNDKYEIDHIRPLSNGGTNDKSNLQALCKSCHRDKTKIEHSNCDHFKVRDYISNYNIEAYRAIKSKFFSKIQFCEYFLNEDRIEYYKKRYNMYSIDDNKCRRNLLINYKFDFPVYSCLDNIEKFDGKLNTGFYYLEGRSAFPVNIFPLRGNGFYSLPMVQYCLRNNIIIQSNIKYQYKPSFTIPKDYFKPFVNFLLETFDGDEFMQKLSPNSLIGLFGRRDNCYIDSLVCDKKNLKDFDYAYTSFQQPYINNVSDDYAIATQQVQIDKLEGAYPIYAQILDCEALELHKKVRLLERNNCIPICVKTDAIVYFAKEEIDISNYYWDEKKTIKKYKHEVDVSLLKKSIKYEIKDKFDLEDRKNIQLLKMIIHLILTLTSLRK